jgi:hypothetical protein
MSIQSALVVSAEPENTSGSMSQVSSMVVWMKTAGDNTFMLNHNVWSVDGSLQGELVSEPRVIIHATGEVLVIEWAVFTGTWDDLEGTLTLRDIGAMVSPGHFHIDATVTRGSGDLAGVYGWGSVDVDMTTPVPSATYSFDLYWEGES